MKVPKLIRLPFGFKVAIKQVSDAEMLRRYGPQDASDKPFEGVWEDSEARLYVRKNMGVKRKRYVVYHELQHAITDIIGELVYPSVTKR